MENLLHNCRFLLFPLQKKRQKSIRQRQITQIVRREFFLHDGQIDAFRLGKIKGALDAGIQEDAIEVRVGFCDTNKKKSSTTKTIINVCQFSFVFFPKKLKQNQPTNQSITCLKTRKKRFQRDMLEKKKKLT